MQKARYSPEPKGHYGLVLADYAHFTSPIRRYPDLAIHRILTDMLVGKPEQELIKDYTGFATHASEQSALSAMWRTCTRPSICTTTWAKSTPAPWQV